MQTEMPGPCFPRARIARRAQSAVLRLRLQVGFLHLREKERSLRIRPKGRNMNPPWKLRTAAILLVGVAISMVGTVVLDSLVEPRDFKPALRIALATGANCPVPAEAMQRIRRAAHLSVYVADPVAGLVAGLFVGLLQKKRAIIVALIALMPNFLTDLTPVHVGNWSHLHPGAARFLIDRSLPFMAAIVGVVLARYLRPSHTSDQVQL
jgi:hypothetical protein